MNGTRLHLTAAIAAAAVICIAVDEALGGLLEGYPGHLQVAQQAVH